VDENKPYFLSDLEEICSGSKSFLSQYQNKSLLVAGATGFIGSWIIASIGHMNSTRDANINLVALSRKGSRGLLNSDGTHEVLLDIGNDSVNYEKEFDCVINAVTPSTSNHGGLDPNQILSASINGTKNLLKIASRSRRCTFINLSSGIVTKRANDTELDIAQPKDAYLMGKRVGESLVHSATLAGQVNGKNLRLYAFAGPGIPLNQHFAIGNFMSNSMNREPIKITGNPDTTRSYMYPTDLITNILTSTADDSTKPIEIGSRIPVSMDHLARTVNKVTGNEGIDQKSHYGIPDIYIPSASSELQTEIVSLEVGIERWYRWLKGPT
jgi:nucleoside-diphosphate-sugar epimerase